MPDVKRVISSLNELSGNPADIGAEDTANKGQPNGYAALDADGNIDPSQMQFTLIIQDDEI